MDLGAWKDDIHIFDYEGREILYQVHTGTFFEIDTLVKDILDCAGVSAKEDIFVELSDRYDLGELVGAIEELEGMDILSFGPPPPIQDVPNASDRGSSAPTPITATLHVSHACNIKCTYCFALGGNYGGKSDLMDISTAKESVNWLLNESEEAGRCQLDFFGGEPLLNFELLKETVHYAKTEAARRNIVITFGMTTNGTLLSGEILEFIMQEDIGVLVSLDGDAKTHNEIRTFHDGSDTHGTIAYNSQKLAEQRPELIKLRATMTSKNLDLGGIAGELSKFGASSVSVAQTTEHHKSPTAIREEHLPELKKHLKKVSKQELAGLLEGTDTPTGHFLEKVQQLLQPRKKEYGCGGGKNYYGVSVDGSIYFCSAFASMPEFKMGDVHNGLDPAQKARFNRELHVDNLEPCKSCWARYLCGGGCAYDAGHRHRRHTSPQ